MSKEQLIDLDKKQLGLLKKILKRQIPNKTVWAYGSRVTWKANEISDLDLAVFECNSTQISSLKEEFEESDLLISVDVMDWESIPEKFKENIKKKYVVLQEKTKLEGWREVRLGDIVRIIGGGTPKTSVAEYWDGDIPWLTPPDFTNSNHWVDKSSKSITGLGLKNCSTKLLKYGDVIISARGTVGALAQIRKPVAFSQTNYGLRANSELVNNIFLFYILKDSIKKLKQFSYGTVFETITTKTFYQIDVVLPPLPEQKAIAEVLSSLDDKIDLLHRQNKTLENIAQTLFRQWFVEEADDGWEEATLYNAIELIGGGTPKTSIEEYWNGDIKWLSGGDVASNHKSIITCCKKTITEIGLKNSSAKLISKFSTVITARGTVGKYCLLSEPMAFSQSNYGVKPKYKNCFFFTYLLINHSIDELQSAAYGSVFDTITTNTFKGYNIQLPDSGVIEKFEDVISPYFLQILNNQSQINTLENLRDTLLPKLMSGVVRVTQHAATLGVES